MRILQRAKSIRVVLTLWYAVVLVLACLAFGASTYFYLEDFQRRTLAQTLSDEAGWISDMIKLVRRVVGEKNSEQVVNEEIRDRLAERLTKTPRNYFVMVATASGETIYRSENLAGTLLPFHSPAVGESSVGRVISNDNVLYHVASRNEGGMVIEVAFHDRLIQILLRNLLRVFALLLPAILFVAVAGGWLMSGVVLRPVRRISEAAREITAQRLDRRLPRREIPDEIGELIEMVNDMIARLEHSFEQISEFSMNVAHELKTPLTVLKGESDLALSREPIPEETQRLTSIYLEETIRMSRIVDDLLMLAKADRGLVEIRREHIVLSGLIADVHEDAVLLSSAKGLTVRLEDRQDISVMGDPERLRQLLRILISNAVRYTDSGGTITISSAAIDSFARIEIRDTGIGIPGHAIERIFEKFYRVDQARTRSKGGSGLGLSIAKWIAEAHRGTITVESTIGKGSSFVVHLPLENS